MFSGTVSTTLLENGTFDLAFPTSAYPYDPSQGTLLLDIIVNSTPALTKTPVFFASDQTGSLFGRVYRARLQVRRQQQHDSVGLVTQFDGSVPVPEASTTVSLGLLPALGAGGLAVAKRRKMSAKKMSAKKMSAKKMSAKA